MTGIRLAFRALLRSPIVTLVVVLSLGLGVGANTAIFSMMYQVLLRNLPIEKPHEVVFVQSPADFKNGRGSTNSAGGMESVFSYRMFRELEKQPGNLLQLAAFREVGANLSLNGRTESGSAMLVSGQYFPVLGIVPDRGRLIGPEDDKNAGNPIVVLGYGYWKNRLGGQGDILNQPLRINGHVFTVVGIAPRNFHGTVLGDAPDVFVPLTFKPRLTPGWDGTDKWNDYYLYLLGRLKAGATAAQAAASLNSGFAGIVAERAKEIRGRDKAYIDRYLAQRITLVDGRLGQSSLRRSMEAPLKILLACTILVLLIASGNAANLLLARAAQRSRELAIRSALGAGRARIMRQLLTEALLLAFAGGVVGILMGYWTLDLLLASLNDGASRVSAITTQLEWPVLLFSFGVSLATGLLFGLYPAWAATRVSLAGTLKDEAANTTSTTAGARVRKILVCGQVALSMILLIPMGLFLKSLVNLVHEDLGMRTESVISFSISPELNGYKPEQCRAIIERAENELGAIPGVSGVATSLVPLIAGNNWGTDLAVEGYRRDHDAETNARFSRVGPGFFSKMGIALLRGREFMESDAGAAPRVAVVNERFVEHFFKGANPIGRRFGDDGRESKNLDIEIVGVIKDAKYSSVRDRTPILFYTPYRQSKDIGNMSFYIRSALPVESVIPQVRNVMSSIDRDLPLEELRTLDEQVQRNIRGDRLVLQLAVAFALLATVLAMLGLYGVMAYGVTRRTREIGIRIALGAPSGNIRGIVMREVLIILGAGIVIGAPAAIALSKLAESQLFGVKSRDPLVIAAAIAALTVTSLVAGYIPARRATRVSPVDALRYE